MDLPESKRIYRYWVEICDRRDGSVRALPLAAIQRIHLTAKKSEARLPDEQVLQLQDESAVIEAKDIDDLAAQLRAKYPDETYERFLRSERDREAERRRRPPWTISSSCWRKRLPMICCGSRRSGREMAELEVGQTALRASRPEAASDGCSWRRVPRRSLLCEATEAALRLRGSGWGWAGDRK